MELTLIGMRSMAFQLGRYLISKQLMLGPHANPPSNMAYFNPHAIYRQQLGYTQGLVQTSQGTKTVDEVKSQIDSIYNTLVSAENLPEMDPGIYHHW